MNVNSKTFKFLDMAANIGLCALMLCHLLTSRIAFLKTAGFKAAASRLNFC